MSKGSGNTRSVSTVKIGNGVFTRTEIREAQDRDEALHQRFMSYLDSNPKISDRDDINDEALNAVKSDMDWIFDEYRKIETDKVTNRQEYEEALKIITNTKLKIGSYKVKYAEDGSYDILKRYQILKRPRLRMLANAKYDIADNLQAMVKEMHHNLNQHWRVVE